METIHGLLKHKKELKMHAEKQGKSLVYNRNLSGYQIISGFISSEVEYPARTSCNKLILSKAQLKRLESYI